MNETMTHDEREAALAEFERRYDRREISLEDLWESQWRLEPSMAGVFEDFVPSPPPTPPPPSQTPSRQYLNALERKRDEDLATLFKRLDEPQDATSNPFEHPLVQLLSDPAKYDATAAKLHADDAIADGSLGPVEHEILMAMLNEREPEPNTKSDNEHDPEAPGSENNP